MHLLYLSDSVIPSRAANGVNVMKMCHAWAGLGHKVTLTSKRTPALLPGIDPRDYYGVTSGFELKRYPFFSFRGSGRLYDAMIPFFGFRKGAVTYTRSMAAAWWYARFNQKLVFEWHEPHDRLSGRHHRQMRFIVERGAVKKWVVISDALKRALQEDWQIPDEQIFVAPDGADPFPEKVKPRPLGAGFHAGYVGSLKSGKGVERIVPLARKMPDVNFHVIGGGKEDAARWKKRVEGEISNLHFHGVRPHQEIPSWLLAFDVLLAPYQPVVSVHTGKPGNNIAEWMSPLKVFEYMASGRPMIASDLPVLREVLEEGRNALLCKPEETEHWAEALQKLKENSSLRKALGEAGKSDLLQNYTWKQRAARIADVLLMNQP